MDDLAQIKEKLRQTNQDFRKLEGEHHRLERELNALVRHKTLTPREEICKKQIQVEKLNTKDRIETIVREFRAQKRTKPSV